MGHLITAKHTGAWDAHLTCLWCTVLAFVACQQKVRTLTNGDPPNLDKTKCYCTRCVTAKLKRANRWNKQWIKRILRWCSIIFILCSVCHKGLTGFLKENRASQINEQMKTNGSLSDACSWGLHSWTFTLSKGKEDPASTVLFYCPASMLREASCKQDWTPGCSRGLMLEPRS